MASMDRMEGDLVEGAAWLLIGLIIIAALLAYLGDKKLLNLLKQWANRLLAWLKKLISGVKINDNGGAGRFNPFGTGIGNSSGPEVKNPDTVFQIPDIPLEGNGLFPLQNEDIPGAGTTSTDQGGGIGVSVGGPYYFTPVGGS